MRKREGFVMIETIIVITILSVGLISLYASYSLILSKAINRSYYDNVGDVYKSYFVGKYLADNNYTNFTENFKEINITNPELLNITNNFNIQKIYLAKGEYSNITNPSNLLLLDGSTITYLKVMDSYDESKINIIVKFVEENDDPVLNVTSFASITL